MAAGGGVEEMSAGCWTGALIMSDGVTVTRVAPRLAGAQYQSFTPQFPPKCQPRFGPGNSSSQPPPETTEILGYSVPQSPRGSALSISAGPRQEQDTASWRLLESGHTSGTNALSSPKPVPLSAKTCADLLFVWCMGCSSVLNPRCHTWNVKGKWRKKKKMLPVCFSVCFGMKSWSISGRCGGEGWVTMGSSCHRCHRETCADEHSFCREAALCLGGTQGASFLWRAVLARASGLAWKQLMPFSPWFIRQVLNLCIIRDKIHKLQCLRISNYTAIHITLWNGSIYFFTAWFAT